MSTPEQPGGGQGLTRKQLREIRMTGATPIVSADAAEAAAAQADAAAEENTAPDIAEAPVEAAPVAQLPRAAEPVIAPPAPRPDAQVDLGVSPLTRRQAREQERIRTASVPVITPDVVADSPWAPPAEPIEAETESVEAEVEPVEAEAVEDSTEIPGDIADAEDAIAADVDDEDADEVDPAAVDADEPEDLVEDAAAEADAEPATEEDAVAEEEAETSAEEEPEAPAEDERPILRPEFGASLRASDAPVFAPSFDELLVHGASTAGSVATPNALILSQTPTGAPLTSPIAATGEVLVTGTFALPDGLGSQGHVPGMVEGKEVDAVLIDGELPASSSPTPIAASAAISTVKGTGEIIRPPAPEKGNKLMLTLAITAGVLAVALVGVLILAFVTGVF